MTSPETGWSTSPGDSRATAPHTCTFGPQGPTLSDLIDACLQDCQVRQFRSVSTARGRTAHLAAFFGRAAQAAGLTTHQIRQYQLARRAAGAATGTINRETSVLHSHGHGRRQVELARYRARCFPDRLPRDIPPARASSSTPNTSPSESTSQPRGRTSSISPTTPGGVKLEILGLTWDEIDEAGGVIRLSPARSKTLVGRILPSSAPIVDALARRRASPLNPAVRWSSTAMGSRIRRWRTAWRTACQAAVLPTSFLHDLPAYRRPQPDPRERPRTRSPVAPDRAHCSRASLDR